MHLQQESTMMDLEEGNTLSANAAFRSDEGPLDGNYIGQCSSPEDAVDNASTKERSSSAWDSNSSSNWNFFLNPDADTPSVSTSDSSDDDSVYEVCESVCQPHPPSNKISIGRTRADGSHSHVWLRRGPRLPSALVAASRRLKAQNQSCVSDIADHLCMLAACLLTIVSLSSTHSSSYFIALFFCLHTIATCIWTVRFLCLTPHWYTLVRPYPRHAAHYLAIRHDSMKAVVALTFFIRLLPILNWVCAILQNDGISSGQWWMDTSIVMLAISSMDASFMLLVTSTSANNEELASEMIERASIGEETE